MLEKKQYSESPDDTAPSVSLNDPSNQIGDVMYRAKTFREVRESFEINQDAGRQDSIKKDATSRGCQIVRVGVRGIHPNELSPLGHHHSRKLKGSSSLFSAFARPFFPPSNEF